MFNAVLKYKFTSWTLLNTSTLVQMGMLTPPSLSSGFRENWTHQGIEYQGEKIRTADSCTYAAIGSYHFCCEVDYYGPRYQDFDGWNYFDVELKVTSKSHHYDTATQ